MRSRSAEASAVSDSGTVSTRQDSVRTAPEVERQRAPAGSVRHSRARLWGWVPAPRPAAWWVRPAEMAAICSAVVCTSAVNCESVSPILRARRAIQAATDSLRSRIAQLVAPGPDRVAPTFEDQLLAVLATSAAFGDHRPGCFPALRPDRKVGRLLRVPALAAGGDGPAVGGRARVRALISTCGRGARRSRSSPACTAGIDTTPSRPITARPADSRAPEQPAYSLHHPPLI